MTPQPKPHGGRDAVTTSGKPCTYHEGWADALATLADPRPTEAEVREGNMGMPWHEDIYRLLREFGCFRPEPAADNDCTVCGAPGGPPNHVYGERKCCPDCRHPFGPFAAEPVPAAEPPPGVTWSRMGTSAVPVPMVTVRREMGESREVGFPSVEPGHVHHYEVTSYGNSAVATCSGRGCRSRRLMRRWSVPADQIPEGGEPVDG